MSGTGRLHDLALRYLTDPYSERSLARRFRADRWSRFLATFGDLEGARVLDLGGRPTMWDGAPVRPGSVVTVNLEAHDDVDGRVTHVQADACGPLDRLSGERFDLVFSNSVIEHVGGHEPRRRFAANVERFADRHWVQTPNRYFPVEAHWIMPFGMQLPVGVRAAATRVWPVGMFANDEDRADPYGTAMSVDLLSAGQLRWYFPDSTLVRERLAGFTKSLIVHRGAEAQPSINADQPSTDASR